MTLQRNYRKLIKRGRNNAKIATLLISPYAQTEIVSDSLCDQRNHKYTENITSAKKIKNVFVHHYVRVIGTPWRKIQHYSRNKNKRSPPDQLMQAYNTLKRIKRIVVATKKV